MINLKTKMFHMKICSISNKFYNSRCKNFPSLLRKLNIKLIISNERIGLFLQNELAKIKHDITDPIIDR